MTAGSGRWKPEGTTSEALNLIRSRGWIVVLLGALVAGGAYVQRSTDWEEVFAGKGYVRWRYPRWKAIQAARKFEWNLVMARMDAGTQEAFRERVLSDERVQPLKARLVWCREEPGPNEEPGVSVCSWQSDGVEVLHGPFDPRSVGVAELVDALEEATRGAKFHRGGGPGFW